MGRRKKKGKTPTRQQLLSFGAFYPILDYPQPQATSTCVGRFVVWKSVTLIVIDRITFDVNRIRFCLF